MFEKVFAVLQATKPISEDVVRDLVLKTISLIKSGDDKIGISTASLAGELRTEGKTVFLGSFGGQQFNAVIDTDRGNCRVAFIFRANSQLIEEILMLYTMPTDVGIA